MNTWICCPSIWRHLPKNFPDVLHYHLRTHHGP